MLHMYVLHVLQGGEDSSDAFSCRSFFAKEPLIMGLFCGKGPVKMRLPMGLRHPVLRRRPKSSKFETVTLMYVICICVYVSMPVYMQVCMYACDCDSMCDFTRQRLPGLTFPPLQRIIQLGL